MKKEIVVISNDHTEAWYIDGTFAFECEPYEAADCLARHLGYGYEFIEAFEVDSGDFPQSLDEARKKVAQLNGTEGVEDQR